MFIRKLNHPNGKTYIQVVEKVANRYVVRKSFGSSSTLVELNSIIERAESWIRINKGILELDFENEKVHITKVLNSITSHKLVGIELTVGKIFDDIGFNVIEDKLFRDLVLYRLVYPRSKLKTTEYMYRYEQKEYSEDDIYRYMDKLHSSQKELIQEISYEHTSSVLDNQINVVFYDVTTIYFEIDKEDELRKTGFSKEGKHQNPQIVLGLLVSKHGYPLAYEIFEGSKFEGHTMLPIVDVFKLKYNLKQLIIIADSGLISQDNIDRLQGGNYEFILGARIKNEKKIIQDKILSLSLKHGESAVLEKGELRLIITYFKDRAKKDEYNREKGLRRLERQIKSGRLTKSSINNRGYNKFLELKGEVEIKLNQNKIREDQKWDGLKGYLTNAKLTTNEIIENYQHLWQIEKAFRITKTDLKIRPIHHRLHRRIEAHICLNFVAYKIYKELERQLKLKNSILSPEKVIEIAQSIYQIEVQTEKTQEKISKILLMTEEHRQLSRYFDFGC